MVEYGRLLDYIRLQNYATQEEAEEAFQRAGTYNRGVQKSLTEFYKVKEAPKQFYFKKSKVRIYKNKKGRVVVTKRGRFISKKGYAKYVKQLR